MSDSASLKGTLKRGALVTAANWPVILIQFVAESTFKLLIGVPIVGGALLVTLALGRDLADLVGGDVRDVVTTVGSTLGGPSIHVRLVRAVAHPGARRRRGPHVPDQGRDGERDAGGGARRRQHRARADSRLGPAAGLGLLGRDVHRWVSAGCSVATCGSAWPCSAVYLASAGLYLAVVFGGYQVAGRVGLRDGLDGHRRPLFRHPAPLDHGGQPALPAAADGGRDRGLQRTQGRAVRRRVCSKRGDATSVSSSFWCSAWWCSRPPPRSIATAGLSLISFVPLLGFAVFPLQAVAWLVRGLVFQYLGLTAHGRVPHAVPDIGRDRAGHPLNDVEDRMIELRLPALARRTRHATVRHPADGHGRGAERGHHLVRTGLPRARELRLGRVPRDRRRHPDRQGPGDPPIRANTRIAGAARRHRRADGGSRGRRDAGRARWSRRDRSRDSTSSPGCSSTPATWSLVELPSYTGAITAFRNAQASLVGVRQEADGIDLDDLDRKVNEVPGPRAAGSSSCTSFRTSRTRRGC